MQQLLTLNAQKVNIVLLVVYAVGVAGVLIPIHPEFMSLTPLNLLTSCILLLSQNKRWDRNFILAAVICFLTGMLAEVAGVATGAIFGEYAYGNVLGPQIGDVPLVIGLMWFMLVYCAVTILNASVIRNLWIKSLIGATLVMGLDILLEPIAIQYGFWTWGDAGMGGILVAPLENYIAWWGISFALNVIFHHLTPGIRNKVSLPLLGLMSLFFLILYLFA